MTDEEIKNQLIDAEILISKVFNKQVNFEYDYEMGYTETIMIDISNSLKLSIEFVPEKHIFNIMPITMIKSQNSDKLIKHSYKLDLMAVVHQSEPDLRRFLKSMHFRFYKMLAEEEIRPYYFTTMKLTIDSILKNHFNRSYIEREIGEYLDVNRSIRGKSNPKIVFNDNDWRKATKVFMNAEYELYRQITQEDIEEIKKELKESNKNHEDGIFVKGFDRTIVIEILIFS